MNLETAQGQDWLAPARANDSPPQPIVASEGLIDLARLNEAAGGSPELVRELIQIYLDQARDILQKLRPAVSASLNREIEQLAHKLAGSSVACGITAVVPEMRQLEQFGRTGEYTPEQALAVLQVAEQQFATLEQFLHVSCTL